MDRARGQIELRIHEAKDGHFNRDVGLEMDG